MKDWNTCFAYLNMELPDDIRPDLQAIVSGIDGADASDTKRLHAQLQNMFPNPRPTASTRPARRRARILRSGFCARAIPATVSISRRQRYFFFARRAFRRVT